MKQKTFWGELAITGQEAMNLAARCKYRYDATRRDFVVTPDTHNEYSTLYEALNLNKPKHSKTVCTILGHIVMTKVVDLLIEHYRDPVKAVREFLAKGENFKLAQKAVISGNRYSKSKKDIHEL